MYTMENLDERRTQKNQEYEASGAMAKLGGLPLHDKTVLLHFHESGMLHCRTEIEAKDGEFDMICIRVRHTSAPLGRSLACLLPESGF
jgi:hypothetical protein